MVGVLCIAPPTMMMNMFDLVSSNQLDVLTKLPIDPELLDAHGRNLAHYARSPDVLSFLGKRGVTLGQRAANGDTPLHSYCRQGLHELLPMVASQVNTLNHEGATPLHIAVQARADRMTEALLWAGAGVEARDNRGMTPLHHAVALHDEYLVVLLSNHEADVTARDALGRTPLHYACATPCAELVEYLFDIGADPNAQDYEGVTPLTMACLHGQTEVAMFLVEETSAEVGRDAFEAAVKTGNTTLVEFLERSENIVDAAGLDLMDLKIV
jgi:ankyrin repeat protein